MPIHAVCMARAAADDADESSSKSAYSHETIDEARQIIVLHNACPVCGFPLMWRRDTDKVNANSADTMWMNAQFVLKKLTTQTLKRKIVCFGTSNEKKTNLQHFHYTDRYVTMWIGKPHLYITPVRKIVSFESVYYELPTAPHNHQLLTFTQDEVDTLFRRKEPGFDIRRERFVLNLGMAGDMQTFSCEECNTVYNVSQQIQKLFQDVLGDSNALTAHSAFYTLIFDSMRRPIEANVKYIKCDPLRQKTWQLELWMLRTMIIFLAFNCKRDSWSPQVLGNLCLKFCHSDMGCLDFLMSQLLATFLYANYELDMTFIDLHQNYLSVIVHWAYRDQHIQIRQEHNVTANIQYDARPSCLWRWILGDRLGGTRTRTEFYDDSNNYWMPVIGLPAGKSIGVALVLKNKYMEFVQDWGDIIGLALTNQNAADPGVSAIVSSLREYWFRDRQHYEWKINGIIESSAGPMPMMSAMITRHSIDDLERAYKAMFPLPPAWNGPLPFYKTIMYNRLHRIVIPQMQYYALQTMGTQAAPGENFTTWVGAIHWLSLLLLLEIQ